MDLGVGMAEEINDFGGSAVDVDEDFLGWGIARSEGGEGVVERWGGGERWRSVVVGAGDGGGGAVE